jgi:hypothetical protein
MRVRVWGARGSVPSPGPETSRYGGNTACVQVTLSDGTMLVLDAGTTRSSTACNATATAHWVELGGAPGAVELAAENVELEVGESTQP